MSARTLLLLAIAAAVALAGGFWASSIREPVAVSGVGAPLIDGLDENVNEVAAIHVYSTAAEPAVTVRRSEQAWRVGQKDDYRADHGQVRRLLLALADARLLEEKTSNPEYYSRIGVQDPAEGGNVAIELDGVAAPRIIVGNRENSRDAFYTRRAGEATSWLANGDIAAPTDPMQWLAREVIDLPAAQVAEVEIAHADGETLRIAKSAFGQAGFDVAGVPDDAELQRANIADPIGAVLASLSFDDVYSPASLEFPERTARITWRTFDGLVVAADLSSTDNAYYARFEADTDAAMAAKFQAQAAEDEAGDEPAASDAADETGDASDSGEGNSEAAAGPVEVAEPTPAPPDMSAAQDRATELNDSLSGWVFELPKYKYDQMTRRMADLLKSESED